MTINTNPSGATIEIVDKRGTIVFKGNSPATVYLKSGGGYFAKQSYIVKITKDGYNEKIIPVECTLNGWYIGNFLIGGILGLLIIDPLTGAMYRLDREFINENLTSLNSSSIDKPTLKIVNINDLPDSMKQHLVLIDL